MRTALEDEFVSAEFVPWGLELRSDHGPLYTGADCRDLCDEWGLLVEFTDGAAIYVEEEMLERVKNNCPGLSMLLPRCFQRSASDRSIATMCMLVVAVGQE